MALGKRAKEILEELHRAVVRYDEDKAVEWAKIALREGVDPYTAVMDGLAHGMAQVGELYARQEYFVPELLLCSDALYAGLDILRPHIKVDVAEARVKRRIVLGVVEGDIHDIGKNLVKIMFDAAGWEVYDLGRDVKLERFVEEQQRTNADVVGMSALMTTSMLAMPEAIKMIRAKYPNVIIMVGGAPLTLETARQYGANGYAESAASAVQEATRLVEAMQKRRGQG